jgi:hypothetical protein
MEPEITEHIFTAGERQMRDHAQQNLSAALNLLNEPISRQDVHEALRNARAASAALEYLGRSAAGAPPPKRGEE